MCEQERRSSLKQASLTGYTICPVEGITTTTPRRLRAAMRNSRCSDVISPASSHSDVKLLASLTTNRNSNANSQRSRQHTSSRRSTQSQCQASAASDVKRRTSSLSVTDRQQLHGSYDDDDDERLQTTSSANIVDTADICNCSPSFGARQPGLAASRRHLADITSTTSSLPAGEAGTTQTQSGDATHAGISSQVWIEMASEMTTQSMQCCSKPWNGADIELSVLWHFVVKTSRQSLTNQHWRCDMSPLVCEWLTWRLHNETSQNRRLYTHSDAVTTLPSSWRFCDSRARRWYRSVIFLQGRNHSLHGSAELL